MRITAAMIVAADKELETIVWPNGVDLVPEYIIFRHSKMNLRYRSNLNSERGGNYSPQASLASISLKAGP